MKIRNCNDTSRKLGAMISGLATRDVAGDGENPIVIENSDDVQIDGANVVGDPGASNAAVSVTDSQNVAIDGLHAVNLPERVTHSNSSFVDTSYTG